MKIHSFNPSFTKFARSNSDRIIDIATMSMLAEPPPAIVQEPKDIQYITGDKLGNGGFAICYRGEMCQRSKPTGKIIALKIVKSQMDRRVIQKVRGSATCSSRNAN